MEVYAIRLPTAAIKKLEELCAAQYLPPRAVVRSWILQRLEIERYEKPAASDEVPNRTLTTGEHQTPVGADAHGTLS